MRQQVVCNKKCITDIVRCSAASTKVTIALMSPVLLVGNLETTELDCLMENVAILSYKIIYV